MSTIFVLLLCNANFIGTHSAPLPGHPKAQQTTHWAVAPETRGTFGLLVSCVLTLVLCLWTSLHLNVPKQNETSMARAARKLMWTLLALFAPELVVYTAWAQWVSAKMLCIEANKVLPVDKQWTMVHAFYAQMGGFVVEINGPAPFLRNKPTPFRVSLTAHAIRLLGQCGHLPDISKEFIADKSKADSLAKLLVCVQAVWCLLQFIGRLASHLPVTLLEVNTLGHAICALAIYMSWWYKPLDVRDPYVLSGDWIPSLCAYMWMCSDMSKRSLDHPRLTDRYELRYIELGCKSGVEPAAIINDKPVELAPGQNLPGTHFSIDPISNFKPQMRERRVWTWTPPFQYHDQQWENVDQRVTLHREDVRRWRLASEAISQYGPLSFKKNEYRAQTQYLTTRIGDAPIHDDLLGGYVSPVSFALVLAIVSAAYGGLHASAWNNFFPTWHECLMWRISALAVVAAGITAASIFLLRKPIDSVLDAVAEWGREKLVAVAIIIPMWMALLFYCGCRIFLVVEAFISIRELPIDAYKTPAWTQLIPHL